MLIEVKMIKVNLKGLGMYFYLYFKEIDLKKNDVGFYFGLF